MVWWYVAMPHAVLDVCVYVYRAGETFGAQITNEKGYDSIYFLEKKITYYEHHHYYFDLGILFL